MLEYDFQGVVGTHPLLRVSLPYADGALRVRLIACYGLLANLEDCFLRASDPSVTRSKLGWWYEELRRCRSEQPSHPLTASLLDSGAIFRWSPSLMDRLFQLCLSRVDHPGLKDERELYELCQAIGSIHLELEANLSNRIPGVQAEVADSAGMAGFTQILRESYLAKLPNFYWIPLTLTADTGLTRSQIGGLQAGKLAYEVMAGLVRLPIRLSKVEHHGGARPRHLDPALIAYSPHWCIHTMLQWRQLHRFWGKLRAQARPEIVVGELRKLHLGDSWAAWMTARRIGRERKGFERGPQHD